MITRISLALLAIFACALATAHAASADEMTVREAARIVVEHLRATKLCFYLDHGFNVSESCLVAGGDKIETKISVPFIVANGPPYICRVAFLYEPDAEADTFNLKSEVACPEKIRWFADASAQWAPTAFMQALFAQASWLREQERML